MAQRKTKCPKCGKPARKEKKLMPLTGKDKVSRSWRVYVHREEVAMGFHLIHECCYVEERRPIMS
jgi:hypothetical protein